VLNEEGDVRDYQPTLYPGKLLGRWLAVFVGVWGITASGYLKIDS
jgi:hypothetical protein